MHGKWQDPQSGKWLESHEPYVGTVWRITTETVRNPFVIK